MFNQKIGFFYIDDENWTGGQDYVVNAINALNFLDKVKQPKVEILVDEKIELLKLKKRITYTIKLPFFCIFFVRGWCPHQSTFLFFIGW